MLSFRVPASNNCCAEKMAVRKNVRREKCKDGRGVVLCTRTGQITEFGKKWKDITTY